MQLQLDTEKYGELIRKLENDELELSNISVECYTQLLASYLYINELDNAKHLWKRIPQKLKADNPELEKLQLLMIALLVNNTSEFFKNINFTWSENIKHIMDDLLEKARRDVFTLVSNAYFSIYESNLMQLTQMSSEQLKEYCLSLGWTYESDFKKTIIIPKRSSSTRRVCANSEDQMFKLTQFVSFLEN